MQTMEQAKAIVAKEIVPEYLAVIQELEAADLVVWEADPQVEGCYGLVLRETEMAVLVVYADGSWAEDMSLLP